MTKEERVARIIARALGHNDDSGMEWERYVLAARLLIAEGAIVYAMPVFADAVGKAGAVSN